MVLVGRTPELGAIRGVLDRAQASFLRVHGARGVGKSALVARAVEGLRAYPVRCVPAPESALLSHLLRAVPGSQVPRRDWVAFFDAVLEATPPDGRPTVLVLDDAHRLDEAKARLGPPLAAALRRARAEGRILHVLAVSHEPLRFADAIPSEFREESLEVPPLSFRAASRLLPGAGAVDRLRAYAVFGGVPRALTYLDPEASLASNVRRCFLEPEAPLGDAFAGWLERDVQNPIRYHAILSALSNGERDWGQLHDAVPDVTQSGQLAPYVQRLRVLGFVRVRRSLDAPQRSRSRRYALADPLFAFWYGVIRPVLESRAPHPDRHTGGADGGVWRSVIRPQVDPYAAQTFPEVCRQFMRHDAMEVFGANAREVGSLWGADYDIAVAGILRSGPAFYGACFWNRLRVRDAPLAALDAQIRETRYGFGRERRLRILFTRRPPPHRIARGIFRRDDAWLLGPEHLTGTAGT